jgi:hypothetical protein
MWTLALILNTLHLVYHQVTSNIDFFPFNNIRHYTLKQRLLEVGINGVVMAFPIAALWMHNKKMIEISCWILGVTLVMEFTSWWRHYFFGPSEAWKNTYDKIFASTLKVLPPIKNNPIPNLEHCILHSLTLISFIIILKYYLTIQ